MVQTALTLTTPAVLFSAISLLLLAYTNRFLALAALVRNLYAEYKQKPDEMIFGQIKNLKVRLNLIRNMQICGIVSLLLCVMCMFLIYVNWNHIAAVIFGIALILLIISLALSVREIQISVKALNLQLSDLE
jgi:glucose uptake protein GlcU